VHQVLVLDRSAGSARAAAGALSELAGCTVVALAGTGSAEDWANYHLDGSYDVALVDGVLARGFLTALTLQRPGQRLPRVVVLADTSDAARAMDLVRLGAAAWVHRSESIDVLIETVHAVLRGEVRLPQPLLDEFLERADGLAPASPDQPLVENLLTRREIQILRLLEQGISRSEIACRLHLSPNTIRSHVQHILSRLGVHSTLAAVTRIRAEDRFRVPAMAGAGRPAIGERR
jgi:DNA-binding NarL/FixJ family response regulator